MKIKPIIEGTCVIVPAAPVMDRLCEAGGTRLKVLLYILANTEFDPEEAADALNITQKSFSQAIEYWVKAGAIACEGSEEKKVCAPKKREEAKPEKSEDKPHKTLARAAQLPRYSADEVSAYVESHNIEDLINACQQYMGKVFNVAEIETLVAMLDYLKLEPDYIMLLFAHCEKMQKKSIRYVEKLAVGLFDSDILGYDELDAHLRAIEAAKEFDKPLRKLFGIGRRALLQKEKDSFEKWTGRWNMPMSVIERAYEITVENTGNASVPYCNAVLERWHASGFTTLEEVNAALAEYRHDKEDAKNKKGSFDTDDFFEAALRRSYSGDGE